MVHGVGEKLGAAAASHVEAVDKETGLESSLGHAAHIAGFAGAFHAVEEDNFTAGGPAGGLGMNEDLDIRFRAAEPGLNGKALLIKATRPEVGGQGEQARAGEERQQRLQVNIVTGGVGRQEGLGA